MKAGKGFCTWHSCMGAAMVGALAIAVSVQGSPRAGERDKSGDKSGTSRLVTGPSAQINDAIAGGATAIVTLQPVAPKTEPDSNYPGGTTIVGQTLNLSSTPHRAWLDVHMTGWAPEVLRTIQFRIDAEDLEMNGGGYAGANADCGGVPAVGAGNLTNAVEACVNGASCRAAISGRSGPCFLGEPTSCNAGICSYGFQDGCEANWIAAGLASVFACDITTANLRCGATLNEPAGVSMNDFAPSYAGSLVVDVPANAKGSYRIDFGVAETFLQNEDPPPDNFIPIAQLRSGTINIACGSCCFPVGPGGSCTDGLSQAECNALGSPRVFRAGVACADEECPSCLTGADCNDGDACTQDICTDFVCSNPPRADWDQVTECCNSATGVITTLGCSDQCEAAACSNGGSSGTAVCNPRAGEACDDDNPCTYADTCAGGAGSCAGLDANAVPCADSADCAAATGVGYACVDGFCNCVLTPDMDIIITDLGDDEDNCFDDGEKIVAEVVIGPSSSPINGGQFLIGYDPSCLDYVETILRAPYDSLVYGPVVNEAAGTIFVAVGVEFGGGDGNNGGPIVGFSFIKIGDCNECNICPLNNNPQNTYLTDNEGQRITVVPNCSKTIYDDDNLVLTTPDNIVTNVDCGPTPTATETWDPPSASAECGNATVICRGEHESGLIYGNGVVMNGGEFPRGDSSFCCYAVSDGPCGTTVGCPPDTSCGDGDDDGKPDGCWTVTVNDETSLDIKVALSPTSQSKPGANLTRCIKFSLYSNCVQAPLVFSDDVTFGGLFDFVGKSTGKIKIPGTGQFECITAQDQLHTLRSCYIFNDDEDCVDGQLHAYFYGDPFFGGNWLISGNLDGWKKDDPNAAPSLDVIDILDWGTFAAEYLNDYGFTDTPCGTEGPHADINGDGLVDLDDYAFISMNFLVSSKACCCGPQTASANAITEISVAQLRAEGLGDLAAGDLNGDGLLNLADMAAFDQGVRPNQKAPVKGGSRSTGSR